jgi:acetyl esterase/lipase
MATTDSAVASSIALQIRALGSKFDPEVLAATRAIYRPAVDLGEAADEQVDVVYGSHVRHRLDIYRPAGQPRAIVVYVHGGGFVAGDKNGDGVFYRNVGRWLARQGFLAVLPNYRLAPADGWPAGARDVQAVLQWIDEKREGLDARKAPLVLWGQSAGASHVATWLFDDNARGGEAAHVDGVMLMSGFFSASAPLPPGPSAYFGEDVSLYEQRSPLTHVRAVETPIWLGVAELDPGWIAQQSYAMARALTVALGSSPSFHFFRGHNHVSTVHSLGSPQHDCGDEVLRVLDAVIALGGHND